MVALGLIIGLTIGLNQWQRHKGRHPGAGSYVVSFIGVALMLYGITGMLS